MSPVSGTVVEANGVLEEKPATINKSPEGEGWIAKIKLAVEEGKGKDELGKLMGEADYKKFTEE